MLTLCLLDSTAAAPAATPDAIPPQNPPSPGVDIPEDEVEFEVRMPNLTMPLSRTNYLCTHMQLPLQSKHHLLEYTGLPMSKYIHHMVSRNFLLGCMRGIPRKET